MDVDPTNRAPTIDRRHRRRSGALLCALVAVAGCGGSASTIDVADPVVQAIASELAADDGDMLLGDVSAAECVATRTVGAFGAERLAQLGIDSGRGFAEGDVAELGFTADEAEEFFGFLGDCVDLAANLAEGIARNGTLTPDQASCVTGRLGARRIEEWLVHQAAGDDTDAFWDGVESASRDCGVER